MAEHEVLTESGAGVATIWLNRPDHRNAFSGIMRAELNAALETFEHDDSVRAIVLTGQGRYFSVGADLSRRGQDTFRGPAPGDGAPGSATQEREPEPYLTHPWLLRTPLIAAMNGSAAGMGLTIPMAWDIRIAAADAKYSFVFPRRGIVAEFGATWLVPGWPAFRPEWSSCSPAAHSAEPKPRPWAWCPGRCPPARCCRPPWR